MVAMAQCFTGTSNINLLVPEGQFGSRLQGGKDAASPRYIFTRPSPITPTLFKSEDSPLLIPQDDDGQPIEPRYYLPVLPMVLVNGACGIGTGFSTSVPQYSPEDIARNLERLMDGEEPLPMVPWYRGFVWMHRAGAGHQLRDPRSLLQGLGGHPGDHRAAGGTVDQRLQGVPRGPVARVREPRLRNPRGSPSPGTRTTRVRSRCASA